MRYVTTIDGKGYKRRMMIRDADGDEKAAQGIPAGPPSLDRLDWEAMKREINNALADQGIFTWNDVNNSQGVGLSLISTIVKRYVAGLYKEDQARAKETALSGMEER
jgi:hypothetical protein